MQVFPVISSILSAAALENFLPSKYRWGADFKCSLIRAGINHTYKIEQAGQRYIFRVYSLNWRSRAAIEAEIRILNLLKQAGVAVASALPAADGSYIQELPAPEGLRMGLLFEFADGEKMHKYPVELHREAGRVMASFHQVVTGMESEDRATYDLPRLLTEPFTQIARFLPEQTEEMQYLRTLQQELWQDIEPVSHQLRKGIAHLDIWFENFSISSSKTLTLYDFDFCGNGWLGLDLAFYSMQVPNVERYNAAEYEPKLAAFFEGYESLIPLSETERAILPQLGLAIYIFYLGIQCERFENWSNTFLSEDYLKRFINGIIRRYDELTRHRSGATGRVSAKP